jgi:ubiquinone/menaquinone biosynthesis C-methylase UbiE
MGTITENKKLWTDYDWQKQGDEWSAEWGTTEILWWGTIRPRINAFVPTDTILEIAPGLGRCTQYLKNLCQQLTVVDLTERCIEACKERFSGDRHITYHVNDGKSLAMIPNDSVDFVFSFDSLVHVEADVIEAYLSQLALKLKPNGVGFLHHSNIGAYVNRSTGKLPFYFNNTNNGSNWRAESMTAKRFEEYCTKAGLQCVLQEVIDFYPEFSLRWCRPGRRLQRVRQKIVDRYGRVLNDCFSVFTRKQSRWARPNKILVNKKFMEEVRYLSALSHFYDRSSFEAQPA